MLFIVGLVIILLVLFCYCACVISSKYSKWEEDNLKKSFKLNEEELFLEIGTYQYGKRLAIVCNTVDEPFSDVTINLPELHLDSMDKAFIDPICKDCGLLQTLIAEGIIHEVIREKVPYNMGEYDLVKFDMDKLKEYDPKGYEEYLNEIGYDESISLKPSI